MQLGLVKLDTPEVIPFLFGNLNLTHSFTRIEYLDPSRDIPISVKTSFGIIDNNGSYTPCGLVQEQIFTLSQDDFKAQTKGGDFTFSVLGAALETSFTNSQAAAAAAAASKAAAIQAAADAQNAADLLIEQQQIAASMQASPPQAEPPQPIGVSQ
jgi:hypothetical protein